MNSGLHSGQEVSGQMGLRSLSLSISRVRLTALRRVMLALTVGAVTGLGVSQLLKEVAKSGGCSQIPCPAPEDDELVSEYGACLEVWPGFQSRDVWSLTHFLALGFSTEYPPCPYLWVFRYLSAYDPIKVKLLLVASLGYLVIKDKLYLV